MTIKLIVAVDQGGAIGWADGRLPWKLAADMKRFKELTTGGVVVMGRTTYLSLGRPNGLPNRRNVVLTRRPYSEVRGQFGDVEIISSLDWVKNLDGSTPADSTPKTAPNIWIIGGASVYDEAIALGMVDEMFVTLVHTDSGGDVKLKTDMVAWKRFVVKQRHAGVNWEVEPISRQWDGDFETSYIHFTKQ